MTPPRRRGPGRRKASAGDSRETVLKAARELFAKTGFRGTTMRAIARRAGVNSALVHYFFESKAKVFAAAISIPSKPKPLKTASRENRGSPGEMMLRVHLEHLFTEQRDSVAAMLRAALGDPGCLPTLRSLIEDTLVSEVADVLRSKDSRLRAELAGAFMVGLFVVRHMVGVEPLAKTAIDDIVKLATPAVNALLGVPTAHRGAKSAQSAKGARR